MMRGEHAQKTLFNALAAPTRTHLLDGQGAHAAAAVGCVRVDVGVCVSVSKAFVQEEGGSRAGAEQTSSRNPRATTTTTPAPQREAGAVADLRCCCVCVCVVCGEFCVLGGGVRQCGLGSALRSVQRDAPPPMCPPPRAPQ